MLPVSAYYALLVLSGTYALLKGGAPERVGAAIIAIGSVLSFATVSGPATMYMSVETGVLLVDVACAIAFLVLALRANRHWPLWIAGLQLIGTSAHAVKFVDSEVIRRAYQFALVFWSYPMLFILVLGTFRHQQRLVKFGADRSWSTSWRRSGPRPENGPTS